MRELRAELRRIAPKNCAELRGVAHLRVPRRLVRVEEAALDHRVARERALRLLRRRLEDGLPLGELALVVELDEPRPLLVVPLHLEAELLAVELLHRVVAQLHRPLELRRADLLDLGRLRHRRARAREVVADGKLGVVDLLVEVEDVVVVGLVERDEVALEPVLLDVAALRDVAGLDHRRVLGRVDELVLVPALGVLLLLLGADLVDEGRLVPHRELLREDAHHLFDGVLDLLTLRVVERVRDDASHVLRVLRRAGACVRFCAR